ncbi:MAG: hypothetical protein J7518_14385 [Nocardioidaceae bacterium]|nr:hypothetical protein [Nocardioidaceae bacterium]
MSGADGVPGRRRALRPFEESAALIPQDESADESGATSHDSQHVRPPLSQAARPAARPANRPPSIPAGPVLLPPGERPAARPPGARRADRPTLVGPAAADAPAGRRVAATPARPVERPALRANPPAPADADPPASPAPDPAERAAANRAARQAAARPHATGARRIAEPTPQPVARKAPRPAPEKTSSLSRHALTVVWVVLLAAATAGVALARASADLPDLIRQVSAGTISVGLAWGLAVRTGGRPIWAAVLTAGLAVGAFVSGSEEWLAGASVGTGVMAATLAVMATVPAATFRLAIREVVVATLIAWVGAAGVLGYGPDAHPRVDADKLGYVVLGLALAGAFALVYRLGAGLHGLGRRGYVVAGTAVVMLALAMAYSEAIAQWGSRDLVNVVDDVRDSLRDTLGAVPHPIVALLGYPALVWGVFMRARRRQGWWVCAFGVAATAPTATRLVASDLSVQSVALGAVYSFVVGIALGYLVIRAEQLLTGTHGRRARRDEEAVAHRPEPGRTEPLH